MDNRDSILSRDMRLFFVHSVRTGSGVHPASYPMDIIGSFPGIKPRSRMVELYLHSH
jgi:hypothetical protein